MPAFLCFKQVMFVQNALFLLHCAIFFRKNTTPDGESTYSFTPGFSIEVQVKASTLWEDDGSHIKYNFRVKNYNEMIASLASGSQPVFLILYCMPKSESEWVLIDEDMLILQKCCYYFIANPSDLSENTSGVSIRIPKDNILNQTGIQNLFNLNNTIIKRSL